MLTKRDALCGKINNVICYFNKCDPFVKLQLLRHYCSDLYGSDLWDLSHNAVENVCIGWRNGLRRSLELPFCTHSRLMAPGLFVVSFP